MTLGVTYPPAQPSSILMGFPKMTIDTQIAGPKRALKKLTCRREKCLHPHFPTKRFSMSRTTCLAQEDLSLTNDTLIYLLKSTSVRQ